MRRCLPDSRPLLTLWVGLALLSPPVGAEDRPAVGAVPEVQAESVEADLQAGKVFAQILDALGERLRARLALDADLVRRQVVDPEMLLPHYRFEYTRQFRPLATAELGFVERVCRPSEEQRKSLQEAAAASLKDIVERYAAVQVKVEQDGFRSWATAPWPNPRELMLAALVAAVEKSCSAEQARDYQLELSQRAAQQKRVMILAVVSQLERSLLLSPEQRARLTAVIEESWQAEWTYRLVNISHYDRDSVPLPLADEQVLPILSEAQKRIWSSWRRPERRSVGWTGYGFIHPLEEPESEPEVGEGKP